MSFTVRDRRGFTLTEVIVVLVILAVLAGIGIAAYTGYMDKSRQLADQAALRTLNVATVAYRAERPSPDLFQVQGTGSTALLQLLEDSGCLDGIPQPMEEGVRFVWDFDSEVWTLSSGGHVVTRDEIVMGTGGYKGVLTGSYTGTDTDIVIPSSLDGTAVKAIYQDAFRDKGLTGVSFAEDSSLTRIHARAFMDNNLTSVVLPDTVTRVDYGAFLNNNITTVTIGSGVTLESNVFAGNNSFRDTYYALGSQAGTYVLTNGVWVKQ